MKYTPIRKRYTYSFFLILTLFFNSLLVNSQPSRFTKDIFQVQTKTFTWISTPEDTIDVNICVGDTIMAKPVLPSDRDATLNYEYTWKFFPANSTTGNTIDSGNKKVDNMAITVINTTQPAPFLVKITIGDIIEGNFSPYCFRVLRVHTVTPPPAPTVNAVQALHFGESTNLQANSSSGNNIYFVWYSNRFSELFVGSSFNVGPITHDTSFYVITRQPNNDLGGYCISDPTRVNISLISPLFIPNAFTPNSDGLNDVFKVEGSYTLNNAKLRIYNQWGILVHQTSDISRGWDGTMNGTQQPAGVYVYILDANLRSNGERFMKHGSVTLLR